jgi:hypothetical protein
LVINVYRERTLSQIFKKTYNLIEEVIMKYPRIIKKTIIPVVIFWVISISLVFILGFECTRKILGFVGSMIGLPAGILSLIGILSVIDENKLINQTLIEAGKKDQIEREKTEKLMRES